MDVWTISYADGGSETAEVESAWSTREKALEYLNVCGSTAIQEGWLYNWDSDDGDHFQLTINRLVIDENGWLINSKKRPQPV